VALLHAGPEHGFRPLTLPLVQVRAAALAALEAGILTPALARRLVRAAARLHYSERSWHSVLSALPARGRTALFAWLKKVPDQKAADARECLAAAVAFARARRQGAPALPPPPLPPPSSHLRRLRLSRALSFLPGGAEVPGDAVLARLKLRPDAGRMAADGLRRLLLARAARSLGIAPGEADAQQAERALVRRLGAGEGASARARALSALGLDDGAARALALDLALEARLLSLSARAVSDGPSWEEGLALGARLSGAWLEEAARAAEPRPRRRSPRS
jgi:hypothetical protein